MLQSTLRLTPATPLLQITQYSDSRALCRTPLFMRELGHIFERLELSQYLENFIEEGFDTWETVLYITESDLDALNVKLGHRRRLQREIAHARGIPFEQLVSQSSRTGAALSGSSSSGGRGDAGSSEDPATSTTRSTKRKYRRHPKPDESAPERPPSAYVIFSNQVREELKPQKLSFTDIAKIVGERWQTLPPEEKETFETQAALVKENYNRVMSDYKKTANFRNYMKYLADFKAKNVPAPSEGKRTKLEKGLSRGSSTSAGSPMDTIESPTTSSGRLLSPPSVAPSSPSSSTTTPTMPTYSLSFGSAVRVSRPQLPRIIPMEPPDNSGPIHANARRTVGTSTVSFLRQDTSHSSRSSNKSGGSTGSSSVFTPITPMDENRPRMFSRSQYSSSSSSADRSYTLAPMSQGTLQDRPQPSPMYSSTGPMKRLSLAENVPNERPTQRPRSNSQDAGLSPPPQQFTSPAPPQQSSQDRSQNRLDPLSVLAIAGDMMEHRGSEDSRSPE